MRPAFKRAAKPTTIAERTDIPVRLADLQPFVHPKCPQCAGSGERWITWRVPDTSRKPMKSGKLHKLTCKRQEPCTCGLWRFLKVQRAAVDEKTQRLYFCNPVVAWSPESQALYKAEKEKAAAEAGEVKPDATP
jgi:hypothetical protein